MELEGLWSCIEVYQGPRRFGRDVLDVCVGFEGVGATVELRGFIAGWEGDVEGDSD